MNNRATEGEDVRRSPQRETTAPRLRAALTTEEPRATRDQSRQPVVLAFAGPANATHAPLPVHLPLDGRSEARVAPAAPVAAQPKGPVPFRPVIEELAQKIAHLPPSPIDPAALVQECRARWSAKLRELDRYDHHAPENAARLARKVFALLNLECPEALLGAKAPTTRRETRTARPELPSRRLVAGAACNNNAWEDLKVIVWDIPSLEFCNRIRANNVDTTGWVKFRPARGNCRLEILCDTHQTRQRTIDQLRPIMEARAGRRFDTRVEGRALLPPIVANAERRNDFLNSLLARTHVPAAPLPAAVGSPNPFALLASAPVTISTPACVAADLTSLRVATWNCRGWNNAKVVELHDAAGKLNLDIIAIQETHFSADISAHMPGYAWLGQNFAARSRGVGFFIREELSDCVSPVLKSSLDNIMWIKIDLKPRALFACCAYAPLESEAPETKAEFFDELCRTTLQAGQKGHVCILSDANARVGNTHPRVSNFGENTISENGIALLELCTDLGLVVINNRKGRTPVEFTRSQNAHAPSILDYVIVSDSLVTADSDAMVLATKLDSDHQLLHAALNIPRPARKGRAKRQKKWRVELLKADPPARPDEQPAVPEPPAPEGDGNAQKIPIGRRKYQEQIERLIDGNQIVAHANGNVDEACAQVLDTVRTAANNSIGTKSVSGRSRPWWDREIERLIVKRRLALEEGNRVAYREACKKVHHEVRTKKALSLQRFAEDLEATRIGDNKRYWATLKRLGGLNKPSTIKEVLCADGTVSADAAVVLDRFAGHFDKLGNEGHNAEQFDAQHFETISKWAAADRERVAGLESDNAPTLAEIREALQTQAPGAPGKDGIPMELLKYGGEKLEQQLCRLYKLWWMRGKTPRSLKEATIIPLHKKDDARDPNNYRGVTLLNLIGKIYTRILNTRLYRIVAPNISIKQAGFVEDRNCVDQAYVVSEIIARFKNSNKPAYLAFLDIVKAYDTVWREALWYKMELLNVPLKLRKVIEEIFTESHNTVRIDGAESKVFPISIGLRQGCVMSPLLFLIFINDYEPNQPHGLNLHLGEKKLKTFWLSSLLFADDALFVGDSPAHLRALLESFTAWCNKWRMVISVPKSKVIALNDENPPVFTIAGRGAMENVAEFKYLGVWFTSSGTWDSDIAKKIARFQAASARAHKTLTLRFLSLWQRTRIWAALCRPVLEYAAEIINLPRTSPMWLKMRAAQIGSLKKILGVPKSAASALVLAECGLPSVDSRYDQAHLRFYFRLAGALAAENNAVLPRAVFARPAPDRITTGPKTASARWFFKEEHFTAAWATTQRIALAKLAEDNEAADEDGSDASPKAVWKEAIHKAAKHHHRLALIDKIAVLKSPAARYYTAEADFKKCKHSYMSSCDAKHAALMFKARTNTLAVASVVSKFDQAVSKYCTACTKVGREQEETIVHFVIECPALSRTRADSAVFSRAVAIPGGDAAATTRLDAVLNCAVESMPNVCETLAKMWKLRCQIHYGAIAWPLPREGEAARSPIQPGNAIIGDLAPGDRALLGRLSVEAPESELDRPLPLVLRPATNNAAENAAPPAPSPANANTNRSLGANGHLPQAEI